MITLPKNCISLEIMSISKTAFTPTLHIRWGTSKAHMRCVSQTNPQIIRSEILSPITEAKAEAGYFMTRLNQLSITCGLYF